jgi:hypothetical protein
LSGEELFLVKNFPEIKIKDLKTYIPRNIQIFEPYDRGV